MKSVKSALIIKEKWLELILSSKKNWEIRGSATSKRGKIALIQSGSGKIYGYADLVDCIGPLSSNDLLKNLRKHKILKKNIKSIRYKKPYAWVLKNVKCLKTPKNYIHPQGAIIWVNLK